MKLYWIVAVSDILASGSIFCFFLLLICRRLRTRQLDIDLLVLLMGSALAVFVGFFALPYGWFAY